MKILSVILLYSRGFLIENREGTKMKKAELIIALAMLILSTFVAVGENIPTPPIDGIISAFREVK